MKKTFFLLMLLTGYVGAQTIIVQPDGYVAEGIYVAPTYVEPVPIVGPVYYSGYGGWGGGWGGNYYYGDHYHHGYNAGYNAGYDHGQEHAEHHEQHHDGGHGGGGHHR